MKIKAKEISSDDNNIKKIKRPMLECEVYSIIRLLSLHIFMCILAERNSLFDLRYFFLSSVCMCVCECVSCAGDVYVWEECSCGYLHAESDSSVCRDTNTFAQLDQSDAMIFGLARLHADCVALDHHMYLTHTRDTNGKQKIAGLFPYTIF